jgi:hypothetical protein
MDDLISSIAHLSVLLFYHLRKSNKISENDKGVSHRLENWSDIYRTHFIQVPSPLWSKVVGFLL